MYETTHKIDTTNYTVRRRFGAKSIEALITEALSTSGRYNNLHMFTTDGINYNIIKEETKDVK